MSLPPAHRGAVNDLQCELERRSRNGEPQFDYFAPTYTEMRHVGGRLVATHKPLLYNYVFIHASERELWSMKRRLPHFNFLRRINDGRQGHFPYLSDTAMDKLRWISRSYPDTLPVCHPDASTLMKGDKVRITSGQFAGLEATVTSQPGAGQKDIIVCIEDLLWVPLLHVSEGQWEIISLNKASSKHTYTHLDNDRIINGLHDALIRHLQGTTDDADRRLAEEAIRLFANLNLESDVMRCKQLSLMLVANTITGNDAEMQRLTANASTLLPLIKAQQSQALLLVTLYGCTDNSIYYNEAHDIIDKWRTEDGAKKSKKRLIDWLDRIDGALGH